MIKIEGTGCNKIGTIALHNTDIKPYHHKCKSLNSNV